MNQSRVARMTTYGKKKKKFFSVLEPSEESRPSVASSRRPSAYGRFDNMRSMLSKSHSRVKLDVDTSNKNDVNKKSPSVANPMAPVSRPASSKSTKTSDQRSNDPMGPFLSSQEQHLSTRPVIDNNTTNVRVSERPQTLMSESSLSFPTHDVFNLDTPASRPGTSSTIAASVREPLIASDGIVKTQRKFTDLMEQATIQEEDTKRKEELYTDYPSKVSPFNWGKKVLVKATLAIRDRLSNYSTTTPPARRSNPNNYHRRDHSSDMSLMDDTDEDDSEMRLIRRIAENRNLAKSKIQTMVGDGNAPRKPLPVYESMKSRSLRSGSEEDPFSDGFEVPASPLSQTDGKLDVDSDKHINGKVGAQKKRLPSSHIDKTSDDTKEHLSNPKFYPTFSSDISGLAQHPNVMDFSSSPLGFSTPRIRLEPPSLASSSKTDPEILSEKPSVVEQSLEYHSDDENAVAYSPNPKSVTDGSQTVKRKSAQGDLRSPPLQTSQKSKLASCSSNEEGNVAMDHDQRNTGEEKIPLSPKDNNIILKPAEYPVRNSGRLTIFEIGDDKIFNDGRKARPRPIIGKRTSLLRPSSMFSNGRESRPGLKRLTSFDADIMDIDELQRDDDRYQIGRNLV